MNNENFEEYHYKDENVEIKVGTVIRKGIGTNISLAMLLVIQHYGLSASYDILKHVLNKFKNKIDVINIHKDSGNKNDPSNVFVSVGGDLHIDNVMVVLEYIKDKKQNNTVNIMNGNILITDDEIKSMLWDEDANVHTDEEKL